MAGETRTPPDVVGGFGDGDAPAAVLPSDAVDEARPGTPTGTRPSVARPAAGPAAVGPAAVGPAVARQPVAMPPLPGPPLAPERSAALQQLLNMLERAPGEFDFFQVLRRLEGLYRDRPERPRFGSALRPADEPIRLGQEPSLSFAPSALSGLRAGREGLPPRLAVHFFGLLGPNGPMPLHLTEYARDRMRNSSDPTMSRFLDVFHHRMLMFFYRGWASGEPTASHDLPETNRFLSYVGSLVGLALPAFRSRDQFPDAAKLFYAGRFSAQARNAEGLEAVIGDFFKMPTRIEPFTGDWLDLPPPYRWKLGVKGPNGVGLLGLSSTLGAHAWGRQQKFRVVMGPLDRAQFQRMLPGGASLGRLTALVRNYIGDEQRWDLRLFLDERVEEPWHTGRSRLGWTSWLGRAESTRREDLILDPQAEAVRAA